MCIGASKQPKGTTPPTYSGEFAEGVRVQVVDATAQRRVRLGPPHFPGRTGVVQRINPMSIGSKTELVYVLLDSTARGKARVETFFGTELILLGQAQAHQLTTKPDAA